MHKRYVVDTVLFIVCVPLIIHTQMYNKYIHIFDIYLINF